MATLPAQALEVFDRLTDHDKTTVWDYVCTAYALKEVVSPTRWAKTASWKTPGPGVSDSKIASTPAQALEALDCLSDHDKTTVLDCIRTAYALEAARETEAKELPVWSMLAMLWILLFTFYKSWSWWASFVTDNQ